MEFGHPNSRLSLNGTVVDYTCDVGFYLTASETTLETAVGTTKVKSDFCDGQNWKNMVAKCKRTWLDFIGLMWY